MDKQNLINHIENLLDNEDVDDIDAALKAAELIGEESERKAQKDKIYEKFFELEEDNQKRMNKLNQIIEPERSQRLIDLIDKILEDGPDEGELREAVEIAKILNSIKVEEQLDKILAKCNEEDENEVAKEIVDYAEDFNLGPAPRPPSIHRAIPELIETPEPTFPEPLEIPEPEETPELMIEPEAIEDLEPLEIPEPEELLEVYELVDSDADGLELEMIEEPEISESTEPSETNELNESSDSEEDESEKRIN